LFYTNGAAASVYNPQKVAPSFSGFVTFKFDAAGSQEVTLAVVADIK